MNIEKEKIYTKTIEIIKAICFIVPILEDFLRNVKTISYLSKANQIF